MKVLQGLRVRWLSSCRPGCVASDGVRHSAAWHHGCLLMHRLAALLNQVEAKREIMLQRLAYVVREHRAMNEAVGDLGSPSPGPGADVMAIINGRQAQVGTASHHLVNARLWDASHTCWAALDWMPSRLRSCILSDTRQRFLPRSDDIVFLCPRYAWAVTTIQNADRWSALHNHRCQPSPAQRQPTSTRMCPCSRSCRP